MAYFDDAKELVNHAKQALSKLRQAYNESLAEKAIKPILLIEIKNLMENLRSALDFSAHELFDAYGSSAQANPRVYFPYATLNQTQAQFQAAKRIETCIPGITATRPDIVARIESYQHFADPSNRWLRLFMALNNENKHQQLTPQTRQEKRALRIESGGAAIELGPGASIGLGSGASISFGDVHIPGGQHFSGENPAQISGSGQQTVIVWISFTFDSNGEEVLPFLETAVNSTDTIVAESSRVRETHHVDSTFQPPNGAFHAPYLI